MAASVRVCPYYEASQDGEVSAACHSAAVEIHRPAVDYQRRFCSAPRFPECSRFKAASERTVFVEPLPPRSSGQPLLFRIFANPVVLAFLVLIGFGIGIFGGTSQPQNLTAARSRQAAQRAAAGPPIPRSGTGISGAAATPASAEPAAESETATAPAPLPSGAEVSPAPPADTPTAESPTPQPTATPVPPTETPAPQPTATPTSAGRPARVSGTNGDGVFVRSGPGTNNAILATLSEGTRVTVTDESSVDDTVWYKVSVGNLTGWAVSTYVALQ